MIQLILLKFLIKNCDEIIVLDIEAREDKRIIENELLKKISKYSTMPFSIGGGIKNLLDAENILKNGAEKICICSDVIENSNEIKKISNKFGAQSIIISIDLKKLSLTTRYIKIMEIKKLNRKLKII